MHFGQCVNLLEVVLQRVMDEASRQCRRPARGHGLKGLLGLSRLAHRVVWANPRAGRPGFAPVAAGMAAALPHVDAFVSGHSLAALERLAAVVAGSAKREVVHA